MNRFRGTICGCNTISAMYRKTVLIKSTERSGSVTKALIISWVFLDLIVENISHESWFYLYCTTIVDLIVLRNVITESSLPKPGGTFMLAEQDEQSGSVSMGFENYLGDGATAELDDLACSENCSQRNGYD